MHHATHGDGTALDMVPAGEIGSQAVWDRSAGRLLIELTTSADSLTSYAERMAWLDITRQARSSAFEHYAAARDRLAADADVLDLARDRAVEAETEARRSCERTRQRVEAEEDRIAELAAEVERLEQAARRTAARGDGADATTTPATAGGPPATPAVAGTAQAAVEFALAQVGKPYGWGGAGPDSYDCSGLMMAAWGAAGVSLPHNSGMQYSATTRVPRDQIQPGDILFFGSPIHHNAMYIGNGQMVEAPRTGLTVRVVSIDRSDYVGAGRP